MNKTSVGFRPGSDGSGAGSRMVKVGAASEIKSGRRRSDFYVVLVALGLDGLLGA